MATKEERGLEALVDEALENARKDRDRILDAYENMKDALDADNREQTVLMGQTATKLLEQLNKVNEQIVKLAQIKERQESKLAEKKKTSDSSPLDIDDIKSFMEAGRKQNN